MATKTFTQFRVDNIVTTLPTTLAHGQEVYYKDANGNLTLWVGHEDGSAWPVCGYKEWVAIVLQSGQTDPTATVLSNTVGVVVLDRPELGAYTFSNSIFQVGKTFVTIEPTKSLLSYPLDGDFFQIRVECRVGGIQIATANGDEPYENSGGGNILIDNRCISIKVYP